MRCLEINNLGETKEIEVVRRDLAQEFDSHIRDLRPIFSLRQMPTIARRGKSIVINFRAVKVVVGADKVLVFNIDDEKIFESFVAQLTERIIAREEVTRFEHVVLDVSLSYILGKTLDNFEKARRLVERILALLRTQHHDDLFEKLLTAKKTLSKLGKNTRELNELLDDILDDDEDLSELSLSKKSKDTDDDVESILENALEQVEDIANRIDELDDNIDDTQEILTLKLSSRRNKIIQVDLILTSITAVFALLAVVTGLFGMNILNNIESSNEAFWWVTGGMIVFGIASSVMAHLWMKKKKIL